MIKGNDNESEHVLFYTFISDYSRLNSSRPVTICNAGPGTDIFRGLLPVITSDHNSNINGLRPEQKSYFGCLQA